MRSLLGGLAVLLVAVALLAGRGFAEPPPPMEARDIKKVIAALEKEKGRRADLAAVRFAAEVLDVAEVHGPVGSKLTTLGAWSQNDTLMEVERALSGCPTLTPEKVKKASALAKEFNAELPLIPRAWTLGRTGKPTEAAAEFASELQRLELGGRCPSEHPMYSYQRVSRMEVLLSCVKAFDPARDAKKLESIVDRARHCAENNHAVG